VSASERWDAAAIELLTELAVGVETCRLYTSEHPRADRARRRLTQRFDGFFDLPAPDGDRPVDSSEIEVAVVQREIFLQGRPFTRTGDQMGVLVRALNRHHIERVGFRRGVPPGEIAACLEFLAGSPLADVPDFSYIVVGSAVSLAGMEGEGGRGSGRPLDLRGRLNVMATIVNGIAGDEPFPMPAVYRLAEGLEREIQKASDPIGLLAPYEDEDSWLHVHAHNTAALSLSMAVALELESEIRHDIAVAAVLHDVGKFGLPAHQLRHDLDLSGSEWELSFNHPQIGLERLLAVPQAPEIACIVAFDHHLRLDGEGYPTLPSPRPPHPAAALVAVAEATDIMLTVRVPRKVMGQLEVVETLHQSAGGVFDPFLARIMAAILQVSRF